MSDLTTEELTRLAEHCEAHPRSPGMLPYRFTPSLRELLALREWKQDVEDTHRMVMEEKCPPPDEKHCTCVPHLRRYITALTDAAQAVVDAHKGVLDSVRPFMTGTEVRRMKTIASLAAALKEVRDGT